MCEPKFIEFHWAGYSKSGVTEYWRVMPKGDDKESGAIGIIKWFGSWRCYAFYPFTETIYEKNCLRDIANFCEKVTKLQREKKKAQTLESQKKAET